MCPDRQILSVYFDQELPSPWKEKLEAHLAECPACRARLDGYALLSRRLAESAPSPGNRGEDLWRRFRETRGPARRRLWLRSVSVPLPAAAAAAAALVFAFAMLLSGRPAARIHDTAVAAEMGLDVQGIAAQDISGVLKYLGSEDTADIVIIRLPESKSFTSLGEPTIIKAADYSRRNPSR
jgi:anti-sigma factor RsiW